MTELKLPTPQSLNGKMPAPLCEKHTPVVAAAFGGVEISCPNCGLMMLISIGAYLELMKEIDAEHRQDNGEGI